jgi:hypothetical protein
MVPFGAVFLLDRFLTSDVEVEEICKQIRFMQCIKASSIGTAQHLEDAEPALQYSNTKLRKGTLNYVFGP